MCSGVQGLSTYCLLCERCLSLTHLPNTIGDRKGVGGPGRIGVEGTEGGRSEERTGGGILKNAVEGKK